MKKSIIKNLIALTFALGALVIVAGNVFADPCEVEYALGSEGGDLTKSPICFRNSGSVLAFVYGCRSNPGNLPPHICTGWLWFRLGSNLVQCSK